MENRVHEPSLDQNPTNCPAADLVWIVMGGTGEYSDRAEWPVYVFPDEQSAKDYVGVLTVKWRELAAGCSRHTDKYEAAEAAMRGYDPQFYCDYTGTKWWVKAVPLAPLALLAAGQSD